MRYAWFLQDMSGREQVDTEYLSREEAIEAALRLRAVHPRSVACMSWDMLLFGPGDGTTTAMVRYLPVAEDEQSKK